MRLIGLVFYYYYIIHEYAFAIHFFFQEKIETKLQNPHFSFVMNSKSICGGRIKTIGWFGRNHEGTKQT